MNENINELQRKIEILEAENESLKNRNKELENQLSWYLEQIRLSNIRKYQRTSESGTVYQFGLFDEAELVSEEPEQKEEEVTVAEHKRKKKTKPDYSKMELEVIHHDLKKEEHEGTLVEVKPTIKEEIVHIPSRTKLVRHIIHNYMDKDHSDDEHTVFVSGENYRKLIERSMASPSLVASVIHKKYVLGQPLYRIEAEYNRQNIPITRQDMSSWVLISAERYLKYLFELMAKDILKEEILYGDETTVKCLEEKDRDRCYMWIQRTSPSSSRQIALYHYNPGREYDFAKTIYRGFSGYLHSDAYGAYGILEGVKIVGCWAHVRRKVYEALEGYPIDSKVRKCRSKHEKEELLRANPSYAKIYELFEMIEELFSVDQKILRETKDYDEIKEKRNQMEKGILDRIFSCLEINADKFLSKSAAGKAIAYAVNCGDALKTYLEDGRLELTNNLGERTVKPFVIGRKNWLFANTARGAESSAIMYSLCETAKANHLKPYEYLSYVLEEMRKMEDIENDPEQLRRLLPYENTFPHYMTMQ